MARSTTRTGRRGSDELVLTAGGWRPKSTIHQIEPGHHLSQKNGRFQKIHTASGRVVADYGEILPGASDRPHRRQAIKKNTGAGEAPFPDNGWIVDAEWANTGPNPISYFSTTWAVPPDPGAEDGQLIFLFNGVTPSDNSYILQPVLQWGVSNNG